MTIARAGLQQLLSTKSRQEFLQRTGSWPGELSLSDARALTSHLEGLGDDGMTPMRVGFVRTFTSDLLDPWLELHAAIQGFQLESYHAPYGLNLTESLPGSGLVSQQPDLTVFLLTRADLHPALGTGEPGAVAPHTENLSREICERLAQILGQFRSALEGHLVLAVLPDVLPPAMGMADTQLESSEAQWWSGTRSAIAGTLREELPGCSFLDLDQVMMEVGRRRFFDLRFWYASRFPFAAAAAEEVARRIINLGSVLLKPKAKVIVLDADNTLWGGIVGEDGPEGIALGPEHPGSAFIDFQRRILAYQRRGFVLALCSKNNPEDVDEILQQHPHQLLRDEHFAARRVNWSPKHENLIAMAEELNLGLESFVFVDDSDHECAIVRRELPMVTVVQTPAKPAEIPGCLDRIARLEILSLTREDQEKTQMYVQERKRREMKEQTVDRSGGGIQDYLATLGMSMRVMLDDPRHLKRLTQLTNKTNQFNLTTRRYDDRQVLEFMESEGWLVSAFSLSDVFGDSGVVGLAIIRLDVGEVAVLDTFLMSCRVIGRSAESAFLAAIMRELHRRGVRMLVAEYVPTRKNRLVEAFLPDHGFEPHDDGFFYRDLDAIPPEQPDAFPIAVELETATA